MNICRSGSGVMCALLLICTGCLQTPPPIASGKNAYRFAKEIAEIGPRFSGSAGAEKTASLLERKIRSFSGFRTETDLFREVTPGGETAFRNVIGIFPGKKQEFILIGSHYDTKKLQSVRDFQGANDGASGNGVMLAVMEALAESRIVPELTLVFVFFDGEEALIGYSEQDGLHGSRRFVREWKRRGKLGKCRAMLLLDMVGDRDLKLKLPGDTHPGFAALILRSAKEAGCGGIVSAGGPVMLDDHTPFVREKIPAADLIDFEYGPENLYWHTGEDTMDKISEESLGTVSKLTSYIIWNLMKIGLKDPVE